MIAIPWLALNAFLVWAICLLYYSCHYKTGYFPVCLNKTELIAYLLTVGSGLIITAYSMLKTPSTWKFFAYGAALIVVQSIFILYIFH